MLLEKIHEEMVKALKEKATQRLGVLRLLLAEVKNEAFKEGKKRTEEEVVLAYHKKLVKSEEEFGGTSEAFRDQVRFEIQTVSEFLPKLYSQDEVVEQLKALEKDGMVVELKTVMPLFKGKADSKMVQDVIRNWK
jgi:uncharacterized protein YqeY